MDRLRSSGNDGLSPRRRQRQSYRHCRDLVMKALFDRVLAGLSDDLTESRAAVAMGNLCDGELEYAKVLTHPDAVCVWQRARNTLFPPPRRRR